VVWWKIHVECGGCVKVVSSQSIWMDWMRLSIWNSPSKYSGSSNPSKWIDYSQPSHSHHTPHESSTKPLTAFSSDHTAPSLRHKQKQPAKSGDDQPPTPVSVPPGHMVINLQEGPKYEWIRGVKFALRHPERMSAASEIAPEKNLNRCRRLTSRNSIGQSRS